MKRKLIFDNSLVRIYDEGHKDVWGRKILKRYLLEEDKEIDLLLENEYCEVGVFVYKTTKRDQQNTHKRLGKNVGCPMFLDCYTEHAVY